MRAILLLLAFLLSHLATAHLLSNKAAYTNEEPAGRTPKIFADNIVSKNDQYEYGIIYSVDR